MLEEGKKRGGRQGILKGTGVPKIVSAVKAEKVCLSTITGPYVYPSSHWCGFNYTK